MIAVACGSSVRLMGFSEDGSRTDIGAFNLQVKIIAVANTLFHLNKWVNMTTPSKSRRSFSAKVPQNS